MKTIIAGTRDGLSYADVEYALAQCGFQDEITEVVSGGTRGVDTLGESWAKRRGLPVTQFIPQWETHGKKAGPMRNSAMAVYGDALVLIWDGASKGSADMLARAEKLALRVHVHKVDLKGYRRD